MPVPLPVHLAPLQPMSISSALSTAADPTAGSPTDQLAIFLMLAGVVLLAVIFTWSARQKLMESRARSQTDPRQEIARIRRQATLQRDPDIANAELHQRAQQVAALLDNKAARLEQLISDAEKQVQRLRATLAETSGRSSPTTSAPTAAAATAAPDSPAVPAAPQDVAIDVKLLPPPSTSAQVNASTPPPSSSQSGSAAPSALDPLTEAVYRLADAGHSPVQIARQLDEQIGKVELILALRMPAVERR